MAVASSELLESLGVPQQEDDLAWMGQGNCMGVDPDLFFPERGASTREAKEVCRGCIVRAQCLEYAVSCGIKFGIWGGMSERERRRIRRARAINANQVKAARAKAEQEAKLAETTDAEEEPEEVEDLTLVAKFDELFDTNIKAIGKVHGFTLYSYYLEGREDGCDCSTCGEAYGRAAIVRQARSIGIDLSFVPQRAPRPKPTNAQKRATVEEGARSIRAPRRQRSEPTQTQNVHRSAANIQGLRPARPATNAEHETLGWLIEMGGTFQDASGAAGIRMALRRNESPKAVNLRMRRLQQAGWVAFDKGPNNSLRRVYAYAVTPMGRAAYGLPTSQQQSAKEREDAKRQEARKRELQKARDKREREQAAARVKRQRQNAKNAKIRARAEAKAAAERKRQEVRLAKSRAKKEAKAEVVRQKLKADIERIFNRTLNQVLRRADDQIARAERRQNRQRRSEAAREEIKLAKAADKPIKSKRQRAASAQVTQAEQKRQQLLALLKDEGPIVELSGLTRGIIAAKLGWKNQFTSYVLGSLDKEGRIERVTNGKRCFEVRLPDQESIYPRLKAEQATKDAEARRARVRVTKAERQAKHLDMFLSLLEDGSLVGPRDMVELQIARAMECETSRQAMNLVRRYGSQGAINWDFKTVQMMEVRRPDQPSRLDEARDELLHPGEASEEAQLRASNDSLKQELVAQSKVMATLRAKAIEAIKAKAAALAEAAEREANQLETIDRLKQALERANSNNKQLEERVQDYRQQTEQTTQVLAMVNAANARLEAELAGHPVTERPNLTVVQ